MIKTFCFDKKAEVVYLDMPGEDNQLLLAGTVVSGFKVLRLNHH
jgi:hypothetical protein